MSKSLLLTAAAAALALGLAACDEQQATENSTVPMQQQGAMPSTGDAATMEPAPSDPTVPPAEGTQ